MGGAPAQARAGRTSRCIDRSNHHLFQPLLYQVATAGLAAPSIAAPLRHILRGPAQRHRAHGRGHAIDTAGAPGALRRSRSFDYDYLLVASGATSRLFRARRLGAACAGPQDARRRLRDTAPRPRCVRARRASSSDAERDACLTFAVIGGGPTGVELAGTLAEIARHTLANEFRRIDSRNARILLIEAGPRVLSSFAETLSDKARRQLEKLGVEVRTGMPVTDIGDGFLVSADERIAARTILWAAGVAASPLGNNWAPSSIARDACKCRRSQPSRRTRKFSSRATSPASAGRQAGAGSGAGRQADGRARGEATSSRAHGWHATYGISATRTSARSPPLAATPPSRSCRDYGFPDCSPGGSGWCCTSGS